MASVSYAVARANHALSRINHPDPTQRPDLFELVGVIQDLRTELHIREAQDNMAKHAVGDSDER